jgi:TIR domain-containing protein
MAHDVYISHARKDQKIAEAICEKLEFAEMRCCIVPRDISPGGDWAEATRKAIRSSRAMVLVFSENANAAPHIEKEIAHAFYTGRTIIPFRLGKTLPRRDFLFYLGDVRWFDAFGPHPEQDLEALTAHIKGLLLGPAASSNSLCPPSANKRTLALNSLNPGKTEVRTSNDGIKKVLKRVAIVTSIFALVPILWFASRQMKDGASPEESKIGSMSANRSTNPHSPPQARGNASAPTPRYVFTRFGLWEAVNDKPAPLGQAGPQDPPSTTMPPEPSASATPSPESDIDQNTGAEAERLPARDIASVKPTQEDPPRSVDRAAPIVPEASSAQNEPVMEDPQSAKLARSNQNQAAVPVPTSSVAASVESTPLDAEENSLKELVLDYIRTVSSDDVSMQERFFAQRVNFYGEGVLSLPMLQASMQRYRREWPVRNWEPRGEPEFPKTLHSTNPKLYEVLQPLSWTVSNGSRHKQGNTSLYVRIRKNEQGEFRIIQVEQRNAKASPQ